MATLTRGLRVLLYMVKRRLEVADTEGEARQRVEELDFLALDKSLALLEARYLDPEHPEAVAHVRALLAKVRGKNLRVTLLGELASSGGYVDLAHEESASHARDRAALAVHNAGPWLERQQGTTPGQRRRLEAARLAFAHLDDFKPADWLDAATAAGLECAPRELPAHGRTSQEDRKTRRDAWAKAVKRAISAAADRGGNI